MFEILSDIDSQIVENILEGEMYEKMLRELGNKDAVKNDADEVDYFHDTPNNKRKIDWLIDWLIGDGWWVNGEDQMTFHDLVTTGDRKRDSEVKNEITYKGMRGVTSVWTETCVFWMYIFDIYLLLITL